MLPRPLLRGRKRIFTDEPVITSENIVRVLRNAYSTHLENQAEIQFLIDYELGNQPLQREKLVRPEIDAVVSENAANYVTEFKKGYFWGIPPVLIQHGDKEIHDTSKSSDDAGIAGLNEMLLNGCDIAYQNQILGDFVEKCGIGHRIVDVRADFDENDDIHRLVNIYSLDSRYTFCVYHNGVGQKKVMGVTYVKRKRGMSFTCYTEDARYEIKSGSPWSITNMERGKQVNPLGMIPIVEFNRAIDRTGCFERHISYMDSLNILVSDFTNDVAQSVQAIWWGDNIDFPEDENGNIIKPESNDWLLTHSGENRKAQVQALASSLDRGSTLNMISFEWNRLLEKCKVPIQASLGGGSTGTATSMATGWQAAEIDALREESVIGRGLKEEIRLILKAISLVPTSVLSEDSALRNIHAQDIDMHFNRNRNYDLSIKANTLATLINAGIQGRHAIKLSEIAPDAEAVWRDSEEYIELKQHKMFDPDPTDPSKTSSSGTSGRASENPQEDRIMQDESDQTSNSPYMGGVH